MEHRRKPRGRFSEVVRREQDTFRRGPRVRFCLSGNRVYKVDTLEMCQWNVVSGVRRAVTRLDGEWYYEDHGAWVSYRTDIQHELEQAFKDSTASDPAAAHVGENQENGDEETALTCPETTLVLLRTTAVGHLQPKTLRAVVDMALAPRTALSAALKLLRALVEGHAVAFTMEDIRRAALFVGSMSVLHIVLSSSPDMELLGFDIFDRRYPGLGTFNDEGRKRCLKALLSRGARLGEPGHVPPSKLLRKIESDTLNAWAQRYLTSMRVAGMDVPDHVQKRIEAFISST